MVDHLDCRAVGLVAADCAGAAKVAGAGLLRLLVPALPGVFDGRRAGREVRDPSGDGSDAKPPAQFVGKVAAVPPQKVILLDLPIRLQQVHDGKHLGLGAGRAPHQHGLAIGMALALARHALEDSRRFFAARGVAEAPLSVVDLHAAVESACPQGTQQPVDAPPTSGSADVVHVQLHRHGGAWIPLPLQCRRRLGCSLPGGDLQLPRLPRLRLREVHGRRL
mmetsp:Transcript_17725/g.55876  ORF Transcript_17725/g.55876 Transcript_17725/m.55876 type:complete len:221 (-) Transcript_17725:276-938(-)